MHYLTKILALFSTEYNVSNVKTSMASTEYNNGSEVPTLPDTSTAPTFVRAVFLFTRR